MEPADSPVDNPLKGLVPYAGQSAERFPHSLEFDYLPLSKLLTGPGQYNWTPLDDKLASISGRSCQAVFRIWLEFPGQPSGLPDYLAKAGVKVTEWKDNKDKAPQKNFTPDYEDERLVAALEGFIAALGQRYDGDARLGFLTAGLLGMWGEWHTYPRWELFASKRTQERILTAYERAFHRVPVLLRYPAAPKNDSLAANAHRRFGYHDDSFAWGTLALEIVNQGVAPFYQDWRLELSAIAADGVVVETWPVPWTLRGLQPSETPARWETLLERTTSRGRDCTLGLRVVNPMSGGKRLRFANAAEDRDAEGWLSLGQLP